MWMLNKNGIKKINSFEMWCYQKMLKISCKQKKSNVWIMKTIKKKQSLIDKIGRAKCNYLGHIIRGNKLLSQILMGKIPRPKARGQHRDFGQKISMTGQT